MTAPAKKPRHRDRVDGPRQGSDGPRAAPRTDGPRRPSGKPDRRSPGDKPKRPSGGRPPPRGKKR